MIDKTFYTYCANSMYIAHRECDSVRLFRISRFLLDLKLVKVKNAYQHYLGDSHWREISRLAKERAQGVCGKCGSLIDLEVHHLNYDCLFGETPEDILVLCEPCHSSLHSAQKSQKLDYARINGWAMKVYGEDWGGRDYSEVAEEFEKWLENKGYD